LIRCRGAALPLRRADIYFSAIISIFAAHVATLMPPLRRLFFFFHADYATLFRARYFDAIAIS